MSKCVTCGKSGLFLKVNTAGECIDCERKNYENTISDLTLRLSPEQNEIMALERKIAELNVQIEQKQSEARLSEEAAVKRIVELENAESAKRKVIAELDYIVQGKEERIVQLDETILLQDFGLYTPKYDFSNSAQYKARLEIVRANQKQMIKDGTAVTGSMTWSVNGNAAQGRKMVKDMQKLLLRAFNCECDEIINKVKYNNFEQSLKRITSSKDAISKLGQIMSVSITQMYYNQKIDELTLAFEYQQMKQKEKEDQRAAREAMREEAKLQKEIEASRKKCEKEQSHYNNALRQIEAQINSANEDNRADLEKKKAEIIEKLGEIEKSLVDIDYRAANQRAGYVYIISNIGSFGEDVYKIGMTRRLDPTERVDELGDASVPFNFDIHAMIFSDDAPSLENALHKALESKRINLVNHRREYFRVSLDEIKKIVQENYEKTAEFIDVADAEQYRVSEKIRQDLK